jgi:capsular exopolysaccharide synthesis family protein
LLITSALPQEGKSFTAANLAQVIVRQHGRRVLLIDADLRGPRLHLVLGALRGPGARGLSAGKERRIFHHAAGPLENFFFIPSGVGIEDPAELVGNGRLKMLLQRLEPLFDWIIIDSPPAVPVSDASLLAKACDGVLMVVRSNVTPSDAARKARRNFPSRLVGVVLNGTSEDSGAVRALLLRGVREEDDHDQGLGGKLIRLFRVFYPVRTLVLLAVETMVVWCSFVLGTVASGQEYWLLRLSNGLFIEGEFLKILAVTGIVLLISHGLDLYDSSNLGSKWDLIFRLLIVLGSVAMSLAIVGFLYGYFLPGHNFLPRDSALAGLVILTFALFAWRAAYSWLVQQHYFRERVYVLGTGERAQRLVNGLRQRGLGVEVVGWTGDIARGTDARDGGGASAQRSATNTEFTG